MAVGGAFLASVPFALRGCEDKPDTFAELRHRWHGMATGGDYTDGDADIAAAVDRIDDTASRHLGMLSTSRDREFLWPDLPFSGNANRKSGDVRRSFQRLHAIALAHATKGSRLEGAQSDSLRETLVSALDWLHERFYNAQTEQLGGWYNWQIGIPLQLTACTMLLYDTLGEQRRDRYMTAVDRACPAPGRTGANRVWMSRVVAQRAALVRDGDKLEAAQRGLVSALQYVDSGDGFYRDGSFIQHSSFAYTGGYGLGVVSGASWLLRLFAGTPWQPRDADLTPFLSWIEEGFLPWVRDGAVLSPVRGRYIARATAQETDAGRTAIQALLQIASVAKGHTRANLEKFVRHSLNGRSHRNPYDLGTIDSISSAKLLATSDSVAAHAPADFTKLYPSMDRVVHRRQSFTLSIAMSSARIANYESINNENLQGWHTGSGALYIHNADVGHYDDAYWATVDPTRIPGTTTFNETFPDSFGAGWCSDSAWAGGAVLHDTASISMGLSSFDGDGARPVTAKKSWFLLGDEIVALGADISAAAGDLATTVENRRLLAPEAQQLRLDGEPVGHESRTVRDAGWAHIEGAHPGGSIGFVFGSGQTVSVAREQRTGSWSNVNRAPAHFDRTEYAREYAKILVNHRGRGNRHSYEYTVLPGLSVSDVAHYAQAPRVRTLHNNEYVQAVRRGSVVLATFWRNGAPTVAGITCHGAASIVCTTSEGRLTLAVADPAQNQSQPLRINLDVEGARVVERNPRVSVERLTPGVTLVVDLAGSRGETVSATFATA